MAECCPWQKHLQFRPCWWLRETARLPLEQLTPRVYGELYKVARAYLRRGQPNQSLQPTALINEAFLRLLDQSQPVQFANRAHFFGIAARLMRQILVDHARTRKAAKRGGAAVPITLDDFMAVSPERTHDVLEIDEALTRLAEWMSVRPR